jgi:hypothetical protein
MASKGTTNDDSNSRPDSEVRLERRREQLQRSRERAAAGKTSLREAEARLQALEASRQDAQRRLSAAEQQVSELKKELKRSAKERERLQEQRSKEHKRSGVLAEEVREAENKYDKAVLADLVRREKERDLAVHAEPSAQPGHTTAPAFTVVDNRETKRSGQVADPDPEVVPADPAPAKVNGRSAGTTRARGRAPRGS